nr:type II secretion system minor pseudopilin GspK [Escherichia coli]
MGPGVQGKVSIRTMTPLNERQYYQLFLNLLEAQGYAVVPMENDVLKVVKSSAAKVEPLPLVGEGSDNYAGDEMVTLRDAQACFNLNALAQPTTASRPLAVQQLIALISRLDVPAYRAELIAESLWEFIDEDRSVQTRLGREDSEYLARSVPFYAANQPLADISEMRVVQGMDAGLYQKLKPLVCALPMTRQQININTLDVTQSVILEALFDPWLSPVQARALLQQRPAKGWEDVDQFLAQPLLADVDERTKKQLKTVLSVDSNYFWLRSDITVNEIELTMNSLIVRMGPQHFSVLWHQTGESE